MGRRRKGQPPGYRRHASGQAFAVYRGTSSYFGKYGTRESRERYRQFLSWWEQQELTPPGPVRTVQQLVNAFLLHARGYYVKPDGRPNRRLFLYRDYLRPLVEQYGTRSADDFGRAELRQLQGQWAERLARSTCNQLLGMVKHVFRWGAREDHVRPETVAALALVAGLPAGWGLARETERVRPADEADVEKTLAHLPDPVADMVRVQLLVGCRPGELWRMQGGEIDRGGAAKVKGHTVRLEGVWTFTPSRHKLRHKGKDLVYLVGPQAQAVLAPSLLRAGEGYLFPTGHSPYYSYQGYYSAIRTACRKAGVAPWSLNQLRHAAAGRYETREGLYVASKVLRHAKPDTTLVYVEEDLRQVAEAVRRLG
jgi:integrase